MKMPLLAFAVALSCALNGAQAVTRRSRLAPAPDLRCLSDEHVRCGCSLKILTLACPASHPTGWKAHFASELNDGAPLWLNLGGRELSLRSHRPVTNSFSFGEGDRWVEEYEGEKLKVVVRYRPAKSTCPAEKVKDGDGCEFFNVAADLVVSVPGGGARTYRALGECGC